MSATLQVVRTRPTQQRAEVGNKHSAMFPLRLLRSKKKEPERDRERYGDPKGVPMILGGAPKKSSLASLMRLYSKSKGDHGIGAEPICLRVSEADTNEISSTTTGDGTRPSIFLTAQVGGLETTIPAGVSTNCQINDVATEPGNAAQMADTSSDQVPEAQPDAVPDESSRPAVLQSEEPEPIPQSPAPPPQPVNSAVAQPNVQLSAETGNGHTTATEAEPTATTTLRQTDKLVVDIMRSPMERLRSLDPASSTHLKADPGAIFDPADRVKHGKLVGILAGHGGIQLFKGRPPPEVIIFLVDVTDESCRPPKSLGTCICIKGLVSDDEIKPFHAVLSQKDVRSYYAPLRLCYERSSVEFAAEEVAEEMSISRRPPGDWTLSGGVVRTESDHGAWETTIGGLIMVGDNYYLMTSSDHRQAVASGSSEIPTILETEEGDGPSLSSFETLVDANFDDDVEQALVIGVKEPEKEEAGPSIRPSETDEPLLLPDVTSIVGEGPSSGHWRLISADLSLRLPNLLSTSIPTDLSEQSPRTNYIDKHVSPKYASEVPSMPGVQEVWMIQLHSGFRLQQGDSGSWVLDSQSRVIGSVIAISDDCAYMVSFHDQIEQIERRLDAEVTIPTAFELLVDLAHRTFPSDPERAMVYAHRALSHSTFLHPGDLAHPTTPAWYGFLVQAGNRDRFAALICKEGRTAWFVKTVVDMNNRDPASVAGTSSNITHEARELGFDAQDLQAEAAGVFELGDPAREPEMWLSNNPYRKAPDTMAAIPGRPGPSDTLSRNSYRKALDTITQTSRSPGPIDALSALTDATTMVGAGSLLPITPTYQLSTGVTSTPGSRKPAHPASMADRSTLVGHQIPSLGARTRTWGGDSIVQDQPGPQPENTPKREVIDKPPTSMQMISRFTIVYLVLNRTIGSAIFIQPVNVLFQTDSSGVAILIWVVGGLIIFAYMLCWLELAMTIPLHLINGVWKSAPRSGGDKNYLEYIYRRPYFLITCVFGITYIIFGNLAAEAVQFGIAMQGLIQPACSEGQQCFSRFKVFGWAVLVVTLCAVMNITTRTYFIRMNNLFAVAKYFFMAATAVVGIVYGTRNGNTCRNISWETKGDKTTSAGDIVLALFFAMYAYTGFEQPFYVLAEVRRPRKVFAKSVTVAMLFLLVLFPLVNVGYMCAIPYENSGSLPKNMAIAVFHLLAPEGSLAAERAVSAILAVFILGSIMAQTFTSSKVIQDVAKEGILPFSISFAAAKQSLLSQLQAFLWRKRTGPWRSEEGEESFETTQMAATFLAWVPTILLLILVGILIEKPSISYELLVLFRTFSVTAVLGLATCAGLLYLKLGSWIDRFRDRDWKSHVQWRPWLDPIPALVAALALGFLVLGAFAPPARVREDDPLPYWAVPLLGWGVPILGVVWWIGLWLVQWRGGWKLEVTKRPFFEPAPEGDGDLVQVAEVVERRRVPRTVYDVGSLWMIEV